jgi:glucokinase
MTQPLLVADIGGTNTRVALADGTAVRPASIRRYRNADFPGLEPVLERFLGEMGSPEVGGSCVAVAGPVKDGRGEMTNIDWVILPETLARPSGSDRTLILNDLQAQGHALGYLGPAALRLVVEGHEAPSRATKLVIGMGTGFNAAPVFESPGGRLVAPAEAGHGNLPVVTEEDLRLARFIEFRHGFASTEDLLSGRGLEAAYLFATAEAGDQRPAAAAEIVAHLQAGTDREAAAAAGLVIRMLGIVAGNLALELLPFGGIYLIGGVTRALTPWFDRFGLQDAFRAKGRFSDFMRAFPIHVVEDDYAALTGCASALSGQA